MRFYAVLVFVVTAALCALSSPVRLTSSGEGENNVMIGMVINDSNLTMTLVNVTTYNGSWVDPAPTAIKSRRSFLGEGVAFALKSDVYGYANAVLNYTVGDGHFALAMGSAPENGGHIIEFAASFNPDYPSMLYAARLGQDTMLCQIVIEYPGGCISEPVKAPRPPLPPHPPREI